MIILGAVSDENAYILAAVSDDVIKKGIKADKIIQQSAPVMNGSGGGRPQLAQAGSKEIKKISRAIDAANTFIKKSLDSY